MEVETNHQDFIHDVQLDFYGKRLATCSSDRSIKIFEVDGKQQNFIVELKGHKGPVWQVNWANPEFGTILASCSNDGSVIIWKEIEKKWIKEFEYTDLKSSVNSIEWSPTAFGLKLACGSSNGYIAILSYQEQEWEITKWKAHQIGVNSVSWEQSIESKKNKQQLVSGGGDGVIRIWRYNKTEGWSQFESLNYHSSWVRCVAWCKTTGSSKSVIASCSQDKSVVIWTKLNNNEQQNTNKWEYKLISQFSEIVWNVSWSPTGNILAISIGNSTVSLWKEDQDGEWQNIKFDQIVEKKL
ncbi:protein sec13 [Anaeramoeba flamelloides]|uniref:Protein sec13 n=1 Tax=Anaeramoeba flamelloides TaxID=1746091 RepID=A0ABQ8YAF9_9EUKA|nr:protein sec13 [Anaeramoeba flamelloides]